MHQFLTTKTIFHDKQTVWLFFVFFALRGISLVLVDQTLIQALLIFIIIMIFGALYFKKIDYAWYILLGELFLGGAGHFLEFFGLSLRTLLVAAFMFLWIAQHLSIKEIRYKLNIPHNIFYLFYPLAFFITVSIIIGILNQHEIKNVIGDALPYSYVILLLPFYRHFEEQRTQEYLIRLLFVFLIGSAVFSLLTFVLFTAGIETVNGGLYYHWFRDVVMGKVTDMGNGFFRIVAPEHLLVVPSMLMISSLLMRDEHHHKLWRVFLFLSSLVLVLDFSRTYFLAVAVGLVILKYKHLCRRWIAVSSTVVLMIAGIFITISFLASGGKTLGLELITTRFGSIARPSLEISAYTRTELLAPIFEQIKMHPILGNGLGSSITFFDEKTLQFITTRQFDWGYLELLAELGLLGACVFLLIVGVTLYEVWRKIASLSDYHDFYVGLLAGLIALAVMTVTSPALFHVFGIFYLVLAIAVSIHPIHVFDRILTVLYRVFNKIA